MAIGDDVLGEVLAGAAGPITILKTGASQGKYGLVRVKNGDGSFNREFKITAQELVTLQASGNGLPPGVSQQEWESGLAVVLGKDFETGDMKVYPNGTIKLKYRETQVNGRFIESWCILAPTDYTGTPPNITITQTTLDSLVYDRSLLGEPIVALNTRMVSIINGIVEMR